MAYIGKQPLIGNFQICDAISTVNGQAAYTLQVGGVNVSPETVNNMIVSVNGVIQKPGVSYTVAGSTITFTSNLVTGDVIDFIQILGSVLDLGTPSDATVTTAKIADGAVTSAKLASGVGGKVLQVVSATRTGFQTIATATATYTDLTGLSVAITPSATSSKVLIMFSVSVGQDTGGSAMARIIIDRGGSTILQGDASGSRTRGAVNAGLQVGSTYVMQVLSQQFLDSPSSTSELTYKLRAGGFDSRAFRINETIVDAAEGATATSSITVMEIGA